MPNFALCENSVKITGGTGRCLTENVIGLTTEPIPRNLWCRAYIWRNGRTKIR